MDSQFCSQCLQVVPKGDNQLMISCKHEDEDGYPIIKKESSCSTSPELSPTSPEFAPTPQKRVRFSSSPEDELKSKSQRRFMRRKSIDNQRSILKQRPSKRVPSQSNYKSTIYTAIGGIDPFHTLNVDQDVKTDIALHHWTTCFQQLRMPLTPRPQWLRICLSDPVILAVTICAATSHFYFFRGMRVPTATYISQKVKAIRAINDALKLPDSIPNDYTIIAVAVMTVLECLAGEPTAWAIHRQGLDKMIKSRGGIQNLGLDDMTQRTVSWYVPTVPSASRAC
ncbi:hypothetical protein B0O99DRAFT_54006 [Bisporella sp. PMI_857]|nr:hypothetical protein B0O99DRAFT_54006 [Bisporella sp. PMI_857]